MMQAYLGRRIIRPLQSGPKGETMIDKSMLYIAAVLLGLLLAAYRPIHSSSAAKDSASPEGGAIARPSAPADLTTIVLPDGLEHAWTGDDATLASASIHDGGKPGDGPDDGNQIALMEKTLL